MSHFVYLFLISFLVIDAVQSRHHSKRESTTEKKCKVHRSPPVHHVMDQICLLCHEMFSHEEPNLRAHCRANCFRNDQFSSCIAMFSSKNRVERDR